MTAVAVRRAPHAVRSVAEPLEPRTLLSGGDPDPTWGVGGTLTLTPPGAERGASFAAGEVVPVGGGKLLIVGQVKRPAEVDDSENPGRPFVARVDAAGRFDTTYGGGDGFADLPSPLDAAGTAGHALLQPDGKLLLQAGGGRLVRLTAAGEPDPTFGGGDGVAEAGFADALALAPDGKILLCATVGDGTEYDNPLVYVARLKPDGSPDRAFGTRGDGTFRGFAGYAQGIAVAPDGRVLVTGPVPDAFPDRSEDDDAVGVGRLRADGTPDPSFGGGDGFVLADVGTESDGAESLAVDAAGRIVVGAYQTDSDTIMPFRLRPDGSVDRMFDPIDFDGGVQIRQTVVRSDGTILFAGFASDYASEAGAGLFTSGVAARYTPAGHPDRSFGGGLGYAPVDAAQVAVLPDGRFLTVGSYATRQFGPTDRVTITRYLASGGADPSGARLSADGTLTVTGTSRADRIVVRGLAATWRGDVVVVRAGGVLRAFDRAAVKRIVVRAGGGNDAVDAYAFGIPQRLLGEGGNDDLFAAAGPAVLDGGAGDDYLHAAFGGFDPPWAGDPVPVGVTLRGGDGNDTLEGGAGDDELYGGAGADLITGSAGNDRIDGGTGADRLSGGFGRDRLDYSGRTAGVRVDLTDLGPDNGAAGEHDYVSGDFEILVGGAGDDVLRGNDADNTIYGNGGNDRLEGMAGRDLLVGGPGRDRLYGGLGDDELYAAGDGSADRLDGGPGRDRARRDPNDDVLHIETFV